MKRVSLVKLAYLEFEAQLHHTCCGLLNSYTSRKGHLSDRQVGQIRILSNYRLG